MRMHDDLLNLQSVTWVQRAHWYHAKSETCLQVCGYVCCIFQVAKITF